jgi:hypothetical protein
MDALWDLGFDHGSANCRREFARLYATVAFRRATFSYNQGTLGGTALTCSTAATLQTSPDGTTWTNEANDVGAIAITAQNTGLTKEIRASQVTAGNRYARLQVVCTLGGTSPTIPVAGLAIGLEAHHKPGSAQNDVATYPAANQNVTYSERIPLARQVPSV